MTRKMKVLYNARRLKDYTQQDLAEAFDVTTVTIRNWETGVSKPSVRNLIKLSVILEITLDEIMNDFDNDK